MPAPQTITEPEASLLTYSDLRFAEIDAGTLPGPDAVAPEGLLGAFGAVLSDLLTDRASICLHIERKPENDEPVIGFVFHRNRTITPIRMTGPSVVAWSQQFRDGGPMGLLGASVTLLDGEVIQRVHLRDSSLDLADWLDEMHPRGALSRAVAEGSPGRHVPIDQLDDSMYLEVAALETLDLATTRPVEIDASQLGEPVMKSTSRSSTVDAAALLGALAPLVSGPIPDLSGITVWAQVHNGAMIASHAFLFGADFRALPVVFVGDAFDRWMVEAAAAENIDGWFTLHAAKGSLSGIRANSSPMTDPAQYLAHHEDNWAFIDAPAISKEGVLERTLSWAGPYPSHDAAAISETWRAWRDAGTFEAAPAATDDAFDRFEAETGLACPRDLQALLKENNGARDAFGWHSLLSVDDIVSSWLDWQQVLDSSLLEDLRDGQSNDWRITHPLYAHPRWIPFTKGPGGDQYAIDLAPGPDGAVGQIITLGPDKPKRTRVARSLLDFLPKQAPLPDAEQPRKTDSHDRPDTGGSQQEAGSHEPDPARSGNESDGITGRGPTWGLSPQPFRRKFLAAVTAAFALLAIAAGAVVFGGGAPGLAELIAVGVVALIAAVLLLATIRTPAVTPLQESLAASTPVDAALGIWFRFGANKSGSSYLVLVVSAEDLYVGESVKEHLISTIRTLGSRRQLIAAIDGDLVKPLAKAFEKIPLHQVDAAEVHESSLWLTVEGSERRLVFDEQVDYEAVGTFVATVVLDGAAAIRSERDVGSAKQPRSIPSVKYRRPMPQ